MSGESAGAMRDAIVVGGGISGLVAAWRIRESGRDALVIEAEREVGGNIRTYRDGEYVLERGPHSFMGSAESIWRLLANLGMEDRALAASAAADNRFVYRDGRLIPIPLSPGRFIASPLLSARAKLRLMSEPFRKGGAKPSDTALEFFHRRFGVEATTFLAGVFVSGIYAGDPARLGARAAFPKFWNFERDHGSMIRGSIRFMREKSKRLRAEGKTSRKGLYSFREGLGFLASAVAARVGDANIVTNAPTEALERIEGGWRVRAGGAEYQAKALVIAAPPHVAARLLAPIDAEAARIAGSIPMAPVAVVHLGGPITPKLPSGFGALIPRHYGIRTLGSLFASQLFPGRAPEGKFLNTNFIGGMFDPDALKLSDDELIALAKSDQKQLMGLTDFDYASVLRYTHAIPQLTPDHPERMDALAARVAALPGLVLAGNYITGVGVDHAVASGYTAAEGVAKHFA